MKIAVIDDIMQCRSDLIRDILHFTEEYYTGETIRIDEYESGNSFLEQFQPESYDIIFVDQYMDGLTGLETALLIRKKDDFAAIVFVTSSREHAVESYTVRACGYLVKPYAYEDFVRAMKLANIMKIRNGRFISIAGEKVLLREILIIFVSIRSSAAYSGCGCPFWSWSSVFYPIPSFYPVTGDAL